MKKLILLASAFVLMCAGVGCSGCGEQPVTKLDTDSIVEEVVDTLVSDSIIEVDSVLIVCED